MALIARSVTEAYLAQPGELHTALEEARRSGLSPTWEPDRLRLRVPIFGRPEPPPGAPPQPGAMAMTTPTWTEPFLIDGQFDDYRTLPPIWRFLDPRDGRDVGTAAYPRPVGPSVLHPAGLVCAHFSRMAYAEHGGPHNNWNGPAAWQRPVEGTQAMNVSAMLARLLWEVRYNSAGRMAPLPPAEAAA